MSFVCFSFYELLQKRKKDWEAQIGKLPDYRRKPYFNDDAKVVMIIEGGCLKTAYGAGFLKANDDEFGVELNGIKSVLHLVDEVVVISGGAPVALASASGNLHKAPDIFRILTSADFFSKYRMARAELMPQAIAGKGKIPPIDLHFAMKALKDLGVNFNAFNELGINITYLTTHAETGARIAIRNPEGELTTLAPRASMTIPYVAGDPVDVNGTYVHDGGFSDDPSGYRYAVEVLGATHVLCASNNHVTHIKRDDGHTLRMISNELRDRPGALEAYLLSDARMREIHDDSAGRFQSAIHNGNTISNRHGRTLRLETTFPAEDSPFYHLELRASALLGRIQTGLHNGTRIADYYLRGGKLPQQLVRPIPTTDETDAFTALAIAGTNALWAAPIALTNMTMAATRYGMSMATIGIRHMPLWGSGPTEPPSATPQ